MNLQSTVRRVCRLMGASITTALLLSACGGGSTSPADSAPTPPISNKVTVRGFAYSGAPMVGATVTVRSATESQTVIVASDGSFSASMSSDVDYRIRAESSDRSLVAYSYAPSAAGVVEVNVNPMTTAIIYNATKINPQSFFLGERQLTTQELQAAELQVQQVLGRTLLQNGVFPDGRTSFLSGYFAPNHTGRDGVLDAVRVAISANGLVVMPAEGLPVDLQTTTTPYTPTADQTRTASIWGKLAQSAKPTLNDAFAAADIAIKRIELADELHIYAAADTRAYVFNGVARISAIVDACFRLIVDGVSAPSWTRVGCAQARCSMYLNRPRSV